jgi:predicted phosphodiesterase
MQKTPKGSQLKPYAVISDVHSNLEALKAVMKDINKRGIDKILFLGDAVGYGPEPNECIQLLKKKCKTHILGNHDSATLDPALTEYFNEYAQKAVLWTADNISAQGIAYLKSMKMISQLKRENICLVHSTPRDPGAWNYLYNLGDIERNFHHFDEKICFVGHSHMPFIAERFPSGEIELYKESRSIGGSGRYIANVGSVGQPRDGDPRSSYVVVSKNTIALVRVSYNIEKTQGKMLKAGLPTPLVERLSRGA